MDLMQIGNSFPNNLRTDAVTDTKLKKLSEDIKKADKDSTDEELMKACKSFEAYMLEQVMTKMEKMAHIDDEKEKDNEYVSMFKDHFIRDAAQMMVEHTDLGIAKMLYESMKRNMVSDGKSLNEAKN